MPEENQPKKPPDRKEMSFLDHLDELRGVILQSFLAVAILSIAGWFVSEKVVTVLVDEDGNQAAHVHATHTSKWRGVV